MRDGLRAGWLWLSTALRAAPLLIAGVLIISLGYALQAPAQAIGVKLLVDGVGRHDDHTMIWAAVVFGGWIAFFFGVGMASRTLRDNGADRVHDYVHADLIRLTTGIPSIVHHERPDVADRIELLHKKSRLLARNIHSLVGILTAVVNAVAILALLAAIHPLLLALPVVGLLRIWTSYLDSKLRFVALERTTQYARLAERLTRIAKSPTNAVEVRTFEVQRLLLARLEQLLSRVRDERLAATRLGMRYELCARGGFGVAFLLAIGWMAVQTRNGSTSAGELALLIVLGSGIEQAAGQIAVATRDTGETIRLFGEYAWLKRYAREMSWSSATETPPAALTTGIDLHDVSFAYPGSSAPVLRGVNLHLAAGRSVALVGENGAGKSTLVKLLARLYDPTHGVVRVDGQDLRDIDPESWRRRCTAAFQDHVQFEFTAARAVGIGDTPRMHDAAVVAAALAHGDALAVVNGLPNGVETQLGKRFSDGVELSGGQWQRLALARGFMRTSGAPTYEPLLLLLDEPTAALDPEAEHALYDRFAAASVENGRRTGAITILVSHRFSTVRMADLIVVLHEGRVTEVGTHGELVAAGGRYAELFELQARAYR